MGKKIFIKPDEENNYIYDRHGGCIGRMLDENNEGKQFVLIVKCGHCGTGYYIPIIFNCKEIIKKKLRIGKVLC